jgi:hypothetical protein
VRPAAFGQCLRGLGRWRRIAVVLSFQVIPADSKHFHHHAGTVDQGIDAGSTAVPPDDGNFLHFEFELSSQEENLGIKTPAFNFLEREDRLNCGSPESFEAALGVLEFQTKGEAQDQVVDSAEELAVQRLALRLGFGPQPARADGDIGTLFKRFEKLGSFFDRRRKVRIAEEDDSAAGIEHAVPHAVSLAAIAGIFQQPQRLIFRSESPNNLCGIVAGAVIHDDDFRIPAAGAHVGQHFLERRAQARALVIGGNHEAVGRIQNAVLSSHSNAPTLISQEGGNVIVRCRFRISEMRIRGILRRSSAERSIRFGYGQ